MKRVFMSMVVLSSVIVFSLQARFNARVPLGCYNTSGKKMMDAFVLSSDDHTNLVKDVYVLRDKAWTLYIGKEQHRTYYKGDVFNGSQRLKNNVAQIAVNACKAEVESAGMDPNDVSMAVAVLKKVDEKNKEDKESVTKSWYYLVGHATGNNTKYGTDAYTLPASKGLINWTAVWEYWNSAYRAPKTPGSLSPSAKK